MPASGMKRPGSMPCLRLGLVAVGLIASSSVLSQTSSQQTITVEVEVTGAQQAQLDEAEILITSGQSEAAYAVLSPLEAALAGNAYFDYLLGVAALDSGMPGEAVFSLRRALAVAPDFSGATMELARAYYEAGNRELAQPLFEQLLEQNPPATARNVINSYLQSIDQRVVQGPAGITPFVEVSAGHDSNANGSTDAQQFLGFTLDSRNVEMDSIFAEVAVGFDWLQVRDRGFAWSGRLQARHRSNPDASFVDGTLISGLVGFAWQRGSIYGNAAVESYGSARDGNPNESYNGLSAMIGGALGESSWHLVGDLRSGNLRFDDNIDVMDVDRLLVGVSLVRRFPGGSSISLQALDGKDSEREFQSPFGNSKSGTRIAVNARINGSVNLLASVGSLDSQFDRTFFGTMRKDDQTSLNLELQLSRGGSLSLSPRIRWIDNDSTVALYDYDRTEIGFGARYILGR